MRRQEGASAIAALAKKTLGELLEPLIALVLRFLENHLHISPELLLTPVITRRALRASRITGPCTLQQCLGGSLVVSGIGTRRKSIAFSRVAPGACVFFDERT